MGFKAFIYADKLSHQIDCMDISPNDQLYVVGGQDGVLKVGNVRTNEIEQMKPLTGHLGDILSCRFVSRIFT